MDLFQHSAGKRRVNQPLPERMRPTSLHEVVGQARDRRRDRARDRRAATPARRAGGPHIVRLSEISPESVSALRVGRLHLESNAELQSSGLLHTISRPVQLMQVMLFAAPIIASEDMI